MEFPANVTYLEEQAFVEEIAKMPKNGSTQDETASLKDLAKAAITEPPAVIREIARICQDVSAAARDMGGVTALHCAVCREYTEGIHTLLELGACVDARTARGKTPLHLAVEVENLEIVRILLLARCDSQALVSDTKKSPLHMACEKANNEIALELVRYGADANAIDVQGLTPLMIAVTSNLVPVVTEMISRGVKPSGPAGMDLADHCRKFAKDEMWNLLVENGWDAQGSPSSSALDSAGASTAPVVTNSAIAAGAALTSGSLNPGSSRLHRAAHTGDVHSIEQFLLSGDSPDVFDSLAWTPLHVAAHNGKLEVATALLLAGGTRDSKSLKGLTPLHLAAEGGHASVAHALLSTSCPEVGNPDTTEQEVWSLVNAQDSIGQFPLHHAASKGNTDVIETLLQAKCAVDCLDKNNRTPLYVAAKNGEVEAVEILTRAGSSLEITDSMGYSPLFIAMTRRRDAVVEVLLSAGASACAGGAKGETPLHEACRHNPSAVSALVRAGAQPGHCWNPKLQSPLHVACLAGHVEAAEQLLPLLSPRQINMRDKVNNAQEGGDTALLIAIRNRHIEMVEALLEAGADPSIRVGSSKYAPLHIAVSSIGASGGTASSVGIVRALLGAGANVGEVGPNGMTPLQIACLDGMNGEVIQALLDAGADKIAPCAGHLFLPPLHLAACGGHAGALRVFLGLPECGGVDTKGPPPAMFTPLGLAVKYGCADAVRLLLEEGADMEAVPLEENGSTPIAPSLIHLAAYLGHGDVISLLLQARSFLENAERKH